MTTLKSDLPLLLRAGIRSMVLIVLSLTGLAAADPQLPSGARTWTDPTTDATFALFKTPRVETGQAVRDQIAGVLDAWNDKPILPIEFGRTSLNGIPVFYMRAALIDGPNAKSMLCFTAYSESESIIGAVVSSDDITLEYLATHTELSGQANPVASELLDDIVQRSQAGLPDLKKALLAKHRVAWDRFREEVRKDEQAVGFVRNIRMDLAQDKTNGEELNRRFRERPPAKIYGWGAHRLSDTQRTVTFIYELNGRTITLVWLVDTVKSTATNISTNRAEVEVLRAEKKLNLPSDRQLMPYDQRYDMTTFKNSDYYRGRGTDQLDQPLK